MSYGANLDAVARNKCATNQNSPISDIREAGTSGSAAALPLLSLIVGSVGQTRRCTTNARRGTTPNKTAPISDVREAGTGEFSGNVAIVV